MVINPPSHHGNLDHEMGGLWQGNTGRDFGDFGKMLIRSASCLPELITANNMIVEDRELR
jgi:hypothetical protein